MAAGDAQAAFLSALMGGGAGSGADPSDLTAFTKDLASNDIYGQIADPIFSARFNKSSWTPMQSGITNALQAFTGTLLKDIGERDQVRQLNAVAKVLPALYENPLAVDAPEGVDPSAFGALKLKALARAEQDKAAKVSQRANDLWGVDIKGKEAQAAAAGKIKGENEGFGLLGAMNPNDPRIAQSDKFRTELLGNKEIASYIDVRDRMKVLQQASKDKSSVADLDYIVGVAKILDPGSVVRESEGKNVIESASIPQSVLGQLNKAVNGETAIPRADLYRLAQRHYDVRSGQVRSIFDDYAQRAASRGITENIFPFSRESLDIGGEDLTIGSAPKFKASDLVAKGYKLSADGKQWELPNG